MNVTTNSATSIKIAMGVEVSIVNAPIEATTCPGMLANTHASTMTTAPASRKRMTFSINLALPTEREQSAHPRVPLHPQPILPSLVQVARSTFQPRLPRQRYLRHQGRFGHGLK